MLEQQEIWRHLDQLTKPPRSLGRLERLAARLCEVQQTLSPRTAPRRMVVFAGDHGVVAAGVSAWPSRVTALMIDNIRAGGAASAVLARATGTELWLINAGTLDQEAGAARANRGRDEQGLADVRYRDCRVRAGTGNLAFEPALSVDEFQRALEVGRQAGRDAAGDAVRVVAGGEMGIGNTTPASCLAMLLAEVPQEQAVGRGAGADDAVLDRKRRIVADAVGRARRASGRDRVAGLAEVAGLEIVAMAGFFLEAHAAHLTIVLDGFVAGAAALVAQQLNPDVPASMIAAHLSAEPGHRAVLERLGLTPFLDWDLRLGEGTGALLLMPLLDAAAALVGQMATFQDLGIARQ